jgi:hypothetical protein
MPDDPDSPEGELIHAFVQAVVASYGQTVARGSFTSSQKVAPIGVKDVDFILKNSDGSTTLCQVKSALPAHYKIRWYARVSPQRLTGLAVLIAGRKRAGLSSEWRSHLSGETGWGLPRDQQVREAAGFVRAAVRYRLQDAADRAWWPVDVVLASRELSNLIVMLATLVVAVISIHGAGLYGLVSNLANVAVVPAFALALIHGGRRYRQVKPPKRQPRRGRQ